MASLVLIIHNVRSIYNVGSLFRTADGLGVDKIVLSGYSPYPETSRDERPPYIRQRTSQQLHKTALGAEENIDWEYVSEPGKMISKLKAGGYQVAALEQVPEAIILDEYQPPKKLALIVGNEVGGIDDNLLALADKLVEIPMRGKKESFNVSVAAAIALYAISNRQ